MVVSIVFPSVFCNELTKFSIDRYAGVGGWVLCVAEREGEEVAEWEVSGCDVGCGEVGGDEGGDC